MLLVDYARDVVGMPMRGLQFSRHIGWTTDPGKAEAMRQAGAQALAVRASVLGPVSATDDPGRIIGYEVTFAVGREMKAQIAA